jgi:hypothetical protein
MCTVAEPHKNTITDFCLVPSRANAHFYGDQGKKIFTCSLDSTIKCWNFMPTNDSNGSIGSPNAPSHPAIQDDLPRFLGNHIQKVSTLDFNPILDLTKPFEYEVRKP